MWADSTFVNMKDVDITDQGPDTGNNDIAVLRGAGWGRSGGWRREKPRGRGGGLGRPQGLSAPSHTYVRAHTHTGDISLFLKGPQKCALFCVSASSSSSYFNKATNQW